MFKMPYFCILRSLFCQTWSVVPEQPQYKLLQHPERGLQTPEAPSSGTICRGRAECPSRVCTTHPYSELRFPMIAIWSRPYSHPRVVPFLVSEAIFTRQREDWRQCLSFCLWYRGKIQKCVMNLYSRAWLQDHCSDNTGLFHPVFRTMEDILVLYDMIGQPLNSNTFLPTFCSLMTTMPYRASSLKEVTITKLQQDRNDQLSWAAFDVFRIEGPRDKSKCGLLCHLSRPCHWPDLSMYQKSTIFDSTQTIHPSLHWKGS